MPKKVAPFWVFYKKFESDLRQKGQKLGREEMHAEASRYWEQMNADDRAWFVENAKEATKQRREGMWRTTDERETFCASSQPHFANEPNMKLSLEDILKRNMELFMQEVETHQGSLREMEFTFIEINAQCTGEQRGPNGPVKTELRPCEISLCRYSIAKGIINRWHGILNPEYPQLTRRKENAAKFFLSGTHQIPFEGRSSAASDIRHYWNSAMQFFRGTTLVAGVDLQTILGALIFVFQKCNIKEVPSVIDAPTLLQNIKQYFSGEKLSREDATKIFNNWTIKEDELGMSCSFHVENAGWKYCTLLRVTRMAFEFSRMLASDAGAKPLIEGAHTLNGLNSIPVFEYKQSSKSPARQCRQSLPRNHN